MSYSIVQYTGDGATATWSVPFPYISKSDVSVKVAGVAATFTWPTTSTVTITPTPANGAVIEIKRSTSPGSRVVDFGNGANLDEASLDNSALQMFYLAQETLDAVANAIALAADGKMDALSKVIKNVTAGVANNDAVNMGQLVAAAIAPLTPTAANIANVPAGNIAATNVQTALNELDVEKAIDTNTVHKSGNEVVTGFKTLSNHLYITTITTANLASGAWETETITHGLGSDDVEVEVFAKNNGTTAGAWAAGMVRPDDTNARAGGYSAAAFPLNYAGGTPPAAGTVRVDLINTLGVAATVTARIIVRRLS